jgi:putative flippase GtrA
VNIATYFFLAEFCGINYLISNIIAWFISIVFAYMTNRRWVFESKSKKIFQEFSLFISGRLLSGIMDTVLLFISVSLLGSNDLISKIVIAIIVVIVNYIFSEYIVFKK